MGQMSSQERMLQAISGRGAVTPCSFMIFRALGAQSRDELGFAHRQMGLKLDARAVGGSAGARHTAHADRRMD